MIDLSNIKNYYIACGYTDLRRGIDGLAQIVMLQYGCEIDENSLFLFCGLGLGPMFRNRATVFTLRLRRTRMSMQIVIDYRSYCYEKTDRYHNGLGG